MSNKKEETKQEETKMDPEAEEFVVGLDVAFDKLQKIAEKKPEVALSIFRQIDVRLGQRTSHTFTDAAMAPARKALGKKVRQWERWEGFIWGTLGGVGIHTVGTKLIPKGMKLVGRLFSRSSNSETPALEAGLDAPALEVVNE